MKQRKIAVETTNKLINENIDNINSPEDLLKVLMMHPQVKKIDTKIDKKGCPYLSILIKGIKRPIKKNGALFNQNSKAFKTALKKYREDLLKEPKKPKIMESGKSRPVPKSDHDRLAELTAKRIKHINEREHRKRTKLGLNREIDEEKERIEYAKFLKSAEEYRKLKIEKEVKSKKEEEKYYKIPKEVVRKIVKVVIINEILSYQQKIFFKLYRMKIEQDLKNYYIDSTNPEKVTFTNIQKKIKVVDEGDKIKALGTNTKEQAKLIIKIAIAKGWVLDTLIIKGSNDFQRIIREEIAMYQIGNNPLQQQILNIKSEQEEDNNQDIKEVKEKLSTQFLLDKLEDKYSFDGLYTATKNKDGKERIQVGTRQLNVSDFLTKEVGLPWREAELLLIDLYEQQKQHILNEDLIKSKRENILLELDGFAKTHGSRKILDLAGQEKEIGNRYYASKRDVVVYKRLSREKEVPILVSEFLDEVAIGDDELEKLMKDLVLGQKREDFKQTYKQVSTLHKYK